MQSPLCSSRAEYRAGTLENGGSETSTPPRCADRARPESDDRCTMTIGRTLACYERATMDKKLID